MAENQKVAEICCIQKVMNCLISPMFDISVVMSCRPVARVFGGGLHGCVMCMYAGLARGVCGHAPLAKCLEIRCSEIASETIFGTEEEL